jgi:hypothetical protein
MIGINKNLPPGIQARTIAQPNPAGRCDDQGNVPQTGALHQTLLVEPREVLITDGLSPNDSPSLDLCPFSAVMHGFCNATWHVNHNLACGSVGGGSGCCIQALEAVWRSKETRGGISFTPCHMASAAPNYTWGRKGLGRTSRRSKRPFGMRASSEQFGRRYSRAISFLSSTRAETAGDQCGAPRAFPRCTAATIVRFRCQRASWRF